MAGLVVHEWFAKHGGSERVVEQMLAAYPDASLFVLWNDRSSAEVPAKESWLGSTFLRRHKALSLPFQLPTWRVIRSDAQYDWILASSHLFSHHARVLGQSHLPKFVYAHTPARYIWAPEHDERGSGGLARAAAAVLKPIDRRRAQEALSIAANSHFTRQRIERSWGREAEVIYPPVDVERILSVPDWSALLSESERTELDSLPENFLLGASRMIPYKRLDLVVEAAESVGAPVVIAGSGPLKAELEQRGRNSTVPFRLIDRPSDAYLFALYQRARALIFPAIEDFGIMPVEAMAAGVPVIVPSEGGAIESVERVRGGAVVRDYSASSWRIALDETDTVDRQELRERTAFFSNSSFEKNLKEWISGKMAERVDSE